MLVDLVIGGVERKALIETSKIGWGVVLDRETGRLPPLSRRAQPGFPQLQPLILEIFDEVSEAARTGRPYQTRLDPPPVDPCVAHPDTRRQAETC